MISLSREAIIAIIASSAALIIPVAVFMGLGFPLKLTPAEKSLVSFSPTPVPIKTRVWQNVNVTCPVKAIPPSSAIVNKENSATVQAIALPKPDPQLSFILYSGTAKDIVILDGHLFRQGQHAHGLHILKIEQKRVQIEDKKGKRWLTMH